MAARASGAAEKRSAWVRFRTLFAAAIRWIVLLGVAVAIVVPIAYAFLGGFRTSGAIRNDPAGLPDPWNFDHYVEALTGDMYWQQLVNSIVIAVITVFIVVSVSALAAYVFARFQFPGREAIFMLFALGLLFPAAVAVLPLVKNKPDLVEAARKLYTRLQRRYAVFYDESGAVGRRYRRQDEIGTPLAVTVDFDSLEDHAVTVRDRDTMEQVRVPIDDLLTTVTDKLGF